MPVLIGDHSTVIRPVYHLLARLVTAYRYFEGSRSKPLPSRHKGCMSAWRGDDSDTGALVLSAPDQPHSPFKLTAESSARYNSPKLASETCVGGAQFEEEGERSRGQKRKRKTINSPHACSESVISVEQNVIDSECSSRISATFPSAAPATTLLNFIDIELD